MDRNVFIGRALASAGAILGASWIAPPPAPTMRPNPIRRSRKNRAPKFGGDCNISLWSGVKKRMRAARRGLPLGPA